MAGQAEFGVHDVRYYGARGDGVTDDTAAIRAALAAASTYGGTLLLPAGTYIVAPAVADGNVFSFAGATLKVIGAGAGSSVLKIKDGALPYRAVIDGSGSKVGVRVEGVAFDHNINNNPLTTEAALLTGPRFSCEIAGSDIVIRDCEVRNASSLNDFYLSGTGVKVEHCRWVNCGDDPTHLDHDSSGIYFPVNGGRVVGCEFVGSAGLPGTRTAIETHGSNLIVRDNVIRSYSKGMNIVGYAAAEETNIIIAHNAIDGAGQGMQLWSNAYGGHTTGYGLDGVLVEGNTIRLARADVWGAASGNYVCGIAVYPSGDLNVRGLKVRGNVIVGTIEDEAITSNHASCGIGWFSNADKVLEDSDISENTIIGMPLSAIRLSCGIKNCLVERNLIRNCGNTLDAECPQSYQTPIFVGATTVDGFALEGNKVMDSFAVTRIVTAAVLASSGARTNALNVTNNEAWILGDGVIYTGTGFAWV